ncbi:MAG: VOC family protein [Gammaproteobacteria bacterium]|nr:VOC family protein [Gammaproteobacteria bacterium]MDE0365101.1 VOC family protein [Gammaproteobacteria bacterium]
MTAVTELGYARFGVSDLDAWKTFASEGIGLQVHPDSDENTLFLRMDLWHHRVILEKDGADDLIGIGLRVAGAEEFRAVRSILDENGIGYEIAPTELARQRCVLELMCLEDPAGNPVELFHGPRVDTHLPFHPGRGMYGKFVTGDGGLGHMVVAHQGFEAVWKFYRLLGMRGGLEYIMKAPDGRPMEIMFMDCGTRDHSIAFGMPPRGRINHIMFEVDTLDDVFHTYERIKENHPIVVSLGKHANDQVFSFYCVSPSGFWVEVGCGAREAQFQSEYYVRDTYGHHFDPGAVS